MCSIMQHTSRLVPFSGLISLLWLCFGSLLLEAAAEMHPQRRANLDGTPVAQLGDSVWPKRSVSASSAGVEHIAQDARGYLLDHASLVPRRLHLIQASIARPSLVRRGKKERAKKEAKDEAEKKAAEGQQSTTGVSETHAQQPTRQTSAETITGHSEATDQAYGVDFQIKA